MVVCLGVLIYAGVQIASLIVVRLLESGIFASIHSVIYTYIWQQTSSGGGMQSMAGRELTKRSLEPPIGYRQPGSDGFQLLYPVIPGVTLPLGHIWYYLLALVICAVVHEFGHAFAAGVLGRVRLRKVGVFVMGIYPGAFVDLPQEHLERQSLWTQLGVVCAGVWHNAVTALFAWLLVYSGGLGWLFTTAGWSHAGDGVVVVDVARSSPLYGKIPLLSTVYQIDDVELSSGAADARYVGSAIAKWTGVLTTTRSNRDTVSSGFCVRTEENVDDGLCCEMSPMFPLGESPDADIYCFEPYELEPERPVYSGRVMFPADYSSMCFDLKAVLERSDEPLRCQRDSDCLKVDPGRIRGNDGSTKRHQSICALPSSPYPGGRVARVHYRTSAGDDEVLIYVGSLTSLWLEVQVSSLMPRWTWLPYRLPSWVESLVQYVLSFSLAFCLLNAIPAWNLDGDHALRLVLLMIQGRGAGSAGTIALDRNSSSDSSQDSNEECDSDVGESDTASSISGSSTSSSAADLDIMELNASYERIHSVATKATTMLLGWCIVGSIVVLAL
ncbi:hypothetical protein LPJ53_005028 [Coemansia erecta]|uniref:Endopeptidase S2P n=1 Tax=Coemansia erecta TaxID=147472 RepID=A0A9W7XXM0_9FUNG|nr:hypothetical protein LPJ53_005028 [Coemansia erecta]